MQTYSDFLLQLDKLKNKEIYARVVALTLEETPIETIEGKITSGTINIDGSSAVRRTCSLSIVAKDFDYSNYMWGLNTKFKLEVGVKNTINNYFPEIIWFKQGIFVLTSFNVSHGTSNFTINLSGKDKMCLLNGENGGVLESSIDFGTIQEEDSNGNWIITKIPLVNIIRNAVHVYGGEPYHNIIINDLDLMGKELLEYRYDTPMYLWRSAENGAPPIYENAMMENNDLDLYLSLGSLSPVKMSDLSSEYLEPLVTTLNDVSETITQPVYTKENGNYIPWYFTKINYGDTAGYKATELVYAGDLISKVGENLTSILDKIKNMLVEYEYFYNLDGQFVFQKKQSFISTMWTAGDREDEEIPTLSEQIASTVNYTFSGCELITSLNSNPNISNLKNDYSIWGERESVTGAKIPIHLRYSIHKKPFFYRTFDNNIFVTEEVAQYDQLVQILNEYVTMNRVFLVDWREIIYQMAQDYFQYNEQDDFEFILDKNNFNLYPNGKTSYESYYTDIQGFWRELYYPEVETDYSAIQSQYDVVLANVEKLQKFLYGENVSWSENKLGGLENDVNALNNLLSNESPQANDLINFWNYGTSSPDTTLYPFNFIPPKYNIKDDNLTLVSDPYLYLSMLQDLYFRQQSIYNSEKESLEQLKTKKDKLEKDKNENYYTDNSISFERKYWNKNVFENPNLLNFWFDFLDTDTSFSEYGVYNLGNRTKAVQDSNIKSIYFRETPQVIFKSPDESYSWALDHRIIQVPSIDNMFSISAQGKSAKEKLDELLYQHTCIVETVSLSTIPIYYLEPNTRVKLYDKETHLNGDYIINKITIPLTYNGTMTLQLTKAIENIK